MSRRSRAIGVFAIAAVLIAVAAYLFSRPSDPAREAGRKPPVLPSAGSCWSVDEATAQTAFPWPGRPVDCAGEHTVELFHVNQVDPKMVRKAAAATGDEAKIQENLMYATARRTCVLLASAYLGGGWRAGRVRLIADWVQPQRSGYFGCAVAETADPAGSRFVRRTGTLRDALKAAEAAPLAIGCVTNDGGALAYAPCDQPHDGEFVGTYTVTPAEAPFDEAAVRNAANRGCNQAGLTYLGLGAGATRSDLRVGYVGPTTASDWLGSDQTFACFVLSTQGRLRGSVKGLATGPLPR
jgi:hypothetical protein